MNENEIAHGEVDEDTDMQDVTEEEAAAAARAAAAQRSERMEIERTQDAMQLDLAKRACGVGVEVSTEEDADPLDAFMKKIDTSVATASSTYVEQNKQEELFGDDNVDLLAIEQDPDDILAIAQKLKKKKDLPAVDHEKMKYEPFRKNFYVEPAELSEMNEDEVDQLRLFLDGIKIRGQDVPKPIQKWSQCGLPAQSLDVINLLGYERPTSIQAQALPTIMSGRNVIGVAKTGSGKTIAFLLPMFRHIKDQRPIDSQDGPVSIIMTPTRELAVQIFKECKPFLKALGLRVSLTHIYRSIA